MMLHQTFFMMTLIGTASLSAYLGIELLEKLGDVFGNKTMALVFLGIAIGIVITKMFF